MKKFKGVFISLLTPMMSDYKVDYKRLGELCEWLIGKGVDGLVPGGQTGEDTTLSNEERRKIIETVIEVNKGRVHIVAGTGAATANDVIYWAEYAKISGADGVLVNPPAFHLENEIIAHFETVSKVGLPIIAHNSPLEFGVDLTADLLVEIAKSSNIVGIQEYSQDIRRVHEILEKTDLEVFMGVDDLAMEGALCGATGWASAVSNAFPEEGIKLFHLAKEGKRDEAREIYRSLLHLYHYDNENEWIQAVKYMMELAGQPVGPTRPPRLALTDETYNTIKKEYEKFSNTMGTKSF